MVEASSLGLANSLTDEEHDAGLLYPRVERSEHLSAHVYLTHANPKPRVLVREISAHIAAEVIRAAQAAVSYVLDVEDYVYTKLLCVDRVLPVPPNLSH